MLRRAMTGGTAARGLWLAAWLVAASAVGLYVGNTLRLTGDLRAFLPPPATAEQAMLLDGIGEGPGARLLLVALQGAAPEQLAETSRRLVEELDGQPEFLRVDNGTAGAEAVGGQLAEYRYLLSPARDGARLDADTLRAALAERLQDLASPAAPILEPLIPADPTLELLSIAESWLPPYGPGYAEGVWFDRSGRRALLALVTAAAGSDPDGQQAALTRLSLAFNAARSATGVEIIVSGPGKFAALMKDRTKREAGRLGLVATAAMVLIVGLAYRRAGAVLIGFLPMASAALAGLLCVGLLFGEVHGITLAFGFTLLGVAQDYPMHLFSHQQPGLDPLSRARRLWPTLATGMLSTCVAYLAFWASGVAGLGQLAWFTISGLVAAGLSTRFLLPRIIAGDYRDPAASAALHKIAGALAALRAPAWLGVTVLAACAAAILLVPGPLWEDDLAALMPVPRQLLEQDMELREQLGAPDVRYLIGISKDSPEEILRAMEQMSGGLGELVAGGALGAFDHAARYLPSARTQRQRQSLLPDADELHSTLRAAQAGLPFREGVFEPFVEDVARSRTLAPLSVDAVSGTPLGLLVASSLREARGNWTGVVMLSGVRDPAAVANLAAAAGDGIMMIDLKRAAGELVVEQRKKMLWTLAGAFGLLVLVVRVALKSWRRTGRVLAPAAASTLIVVALLHGVGQPLNVFHLIALVLAAGLGLDYALFFEWSAGEPAEQRRTLHAVLVCALSTLVVFTLLAISAIPVLGAIGLTVALGVTANFALSALLMRKPAPEGADGA